ncbi:MAG: phosphate transport system permease protein [Solirubrobacterales bacterium]|jgi:phosphate transport system permease protein|nr:phosphate transport system permease protein [Solirubrobacterales bacterium]
MAEPVDKRAAAIAEGSTLALASGGIEGGVLPAWTPYGVFAGSAALAAAALLATGVFTVALMLVFAVLVALVGTYVLSRAVEGPRRAKDRTVTLAIASAFGLAMIPLLSLIFEVAKRGLPGISLEFFTESARGVVNGGGAAHAIVGTLVITGVAVVISVPIGLMAAIYMTEYGTGRLRRALTLFVDVMTGIPSIVAGLFAYALFEIFFGPGIRLGVMGSVALSVLMIPIVIRSAEEVLKIVPNQLREAAYALGTPKWRTITKVVLPTAFAGLVTGVMLATARIIGETAPLLVTTGVVDSINSDPFNGRMQNLAVYAYNEYRSPGVMKQASYDRAWAAVLTLIAIVMILNVVARLIYRRYRTEIR